MDALRDGITVKGAGTKDPEDEENEGAGRHIVFRHSFNRGSVPMPLAGVKGEFGRPATVVRVWKARKGSGILEARLMRCSLHAPIAPGRTVGACVCLVAVLLLWTPMWASAWMMRGMACCTGTMCTAHLHTKTNAPAKSEAECEHSRGAGMAACSISCCHDEGASLAVNSGVYVLPEAVEIAAPAETMSLAVAAKQEEVMQVFAPPSPPPERLPL